VVWLSGACIVGGVGGSGSIAGGSSVDGAGGGGSVGWPAPSAVGGVGPAAASSMMTNRPSTAAIEPANVSSAVT
jgi:hypothetical protein